MRNGQFFKKILIYIFFINLIVTRGNALQIAPNHVNLSKKRMVLRLVTHWSYGNVLN